MADQTTELLHDKAIGLDTRPLAEIASILAEGQIAAANAVLAATDSISSAASRLARAIDDGGTLHYVAAGSSGLMAAADAQELGGTFSIPAHQLRIYMAGGLPTGVEMPGDTEDAASGLQELLQELTCKDAVIAVSASGSTAYTIAAAKIAKKTGVALIGIANNSDTPLLALADFPIYLETPPEVISGSTRMGAGTAQKIALNMLSTMMAMKLGHVHDGMMVNLFADNGKLRARANGIVRRIAGSTEAEAKYALDAAEGRVKSAILIAATGLSPDEARAALQASGGRLRPILAAKN